MKNVYKWRITTTKYLYITDEQNTAPFIFDKVKSERIYSGSTIPEPSSVDDGLIAQNVANINNPSTYETMFNDMVALCMTDPDGAKLTFLSYDNYFNLNNDECVIEAMTPKCEGYDPIFHFSAYTLDDSSEVEYEFYPEKNEADKTLRYHFILGVPRGEKGEDGDIGIGCKGDKGDDGKDAVIDADAIAVGLDSSETPYVTLDVESGETESANTYNLHFTFGIPQGEKGERGYTGDDGENGKPAVFGDVTASATGLPYGSDPTVDVVSATTEYDDAMYTTVNFNFGIPEGSQGEQGDPGAPAIFSSITAQAHTIAPESSATVDVTYEVDDPSLNTYILNFDFGIPQGEPGESGGTGGSGYVYNFDDINFIEYNDTVPRGDFDVDYYPSAGYAEVHTTIYYPSSWGQGGGGGSARGYVWTNTKNGVLINSFAEGDTATTEGLTGQPEANGYRSHAEGVNTLASNAGSHAEGYKTAAVGDYSHAEGIGETGNTEQITILGKLINCSPNSNTVVIAKTELIGKAFNSLVGCTFTIDDLQKIEPEYRNVVTTATIYTINNCTYTADSEDEHIKFSDIQITFTDINNNVCVMAMDDIISGNIEGQTLYVSSISGSANGRASHVEGGMTKASADFSHAEGWVTHAEGTSSHAEGIQTYTDGAGSHAEGFQTQAVGKASHAEGSSNHRISNGAITSEGNIIADGEGNHVGGYTYGGEISSHEDSKGNIVRGYASSGGRIYCDDDSEGSFINGYATGNGSEIYSDEDGTVAMGYVGNGGKIHSHGEGSFVHGYADGSNSNILTNYSGSVAIGWASGGTIEANGEGSFAGGYSDGGEIIADNKGSFAYGEDVGAYGEASHAEGIYNRFDNESSTVDVTITAVGNPTSGYFRWKSSDRQPSLSLAFEYNNRKYMFKSLYPSFDTSADCPIYSFTCNGGIFTSTGVVADVEVYCGYGAYGKGSHVEGNYCGAYGADSHAEGYYAEAVADHSHAEGAECHAYGEASHAEGYNTTAAGQNSHAECYNTKANGDNSHAEGYNTKALGDYSHAEGIGFSNNSTTSLIPTQIDTCCFDTHETIFKILRSDAYTFNSLSLVGGTFTVNDLSIFKSDISSTVTTSTVFTIISCEIVNDENYYMRVKNVFVSYRDNNGYDHQVSFGSLLSTSDWITISTTISVNVVHGYANGDASHVEGCATLAEGVYSHAEGWLTQSFGTASHAEGIETIAENFATHASGSYTIADQSCQFVCGKYNTINNTNSLFVVGNGSGGGSGRSDAMVVDGSGNVTAAGQFYALSDKRKKNVIGEIDLNKAYELIDKCSTILYTWKDNANENTENKEQVGVIAQEVQEFFPEIVKETPSGFLTLDYSRLTVILLRVMKDLINRIENLEKK